MAKEYDLLPGQTEPVKDFETTPHSFALNHLGDALFVAIMEGSTYTSHAVHLNDTVLDHSARGGVTTVIVGDAGPLVLTNAVDLVLGS